MYIPIWVLILAIIVALFYFKKQKTKKNSEEDKLNPKEDKFSPGENWTKAEWYKKQVMEKSPLIEKYLQDERDMIEAMEFDMIKLRERYKFDSNKQVEIAQDWCDFAYAVYEVKNQREWIDVETDDNAFDSHWDELFKFNTIIYEIGKRVSELLGEESNIKKVRERIENKKPKEIGGLFKEVFKEVAKKKDK